MAGTTLFARILTTSFMVLAMAGCGTLAEPGAPDQSFDVNDDIKALEDAFKQHASISGFYENDGTQTKPKRDKFIIARLTLINIQYIKFIRQFAVDKAQLDTAADVLVIGLDLAGTLAGGASVKAILAAASGGISSSRISITKNFFQEKTVPVLITAMNAARKEALVPILWGLKKPIEDYQFGQAVADLNFYYHAGTFVGALQDIQKEAGIKEREQDDKLAKFRENIFTEDESAVRIRKFIYPPNGDTSGAFDKVNSKKLRSWIDKSVVKGLPIANFWTNSELKVLRERAIRDLFIP